MSHTHPVYGCLPPPPTTLLIPLPLANSASCFCFFGSAHFLRAGLAAKAGGRPAQELSIPSTTLLSPERKCRTGQKTRSFPTSSLIACPKKITEDIRLLRRPDEREAKKANENHFLLHSAGASDTTRGEGCYCWDQREMNICHKQQGRPFRPKQENNLERMQTKQYSQSKKTRKILI